MIIRLAGVSFCPGYPRNLADLVPRLEHDGPVGAELVREADNAHDPNAVAVHVEGRMLGHIPAQFVPRLAERMDQGVTFDVAVTSVPVHEEHPERPGCNVQIVRR